MKRPSSHILTPFLVLAITATTLLFSASTPAYAVLGVGDVTATIETVSIPQIFFNSIIKAIEAAGYTVLRKAMRQALGNITKNVMNNLLEGGKGKSELFQTEPWEQFWEQAGDEASGAALEGFVQGFQNEYEAQNKKAEALKNLEDKETATLQPQIENASKLADDLTVCGMENVSTGGDSSPICATQKAAAEAASGTLKKNTDNTFTVQKRVLLVKRTSLEKTAASARREYDQCGDDKTTATCVAKKTALTAAETALDTNQKDLNSALAGADKATAAELKKIDKAANKKDADLITGQTGALTDASRTLIDIVCKPTPDIALSFFLPLGDRIEEKPRRKPICPYSKIKENWQEIYNNTGTRLDEASLGNWRTLAGLVNPNTSDIGAAYGVSIAGHSVSEVAKALGVTEYQGFDVAGGLKKITEYNGKVTTPVSSSVAILEETIKGGIQEDTRLSPTGHLVADLVTTGIATIFNTAAGILQEGLNKKTRTVRQPKQNRGVAALSQFQQNNTLYFPNADPNAGSHQFAEARLASFDALELSPEQNWDVLNKITAVGGNPTCYNPTGSLDERATDVESCTIDEKFNEAIRKGLTVEEAVYGDKPLLNGDGIFGFDISADDSRTEPAFERNFPYHSLVILRKYRIIPVSWELAALYINSMRGSGTCDGTNKNCSLKYLMSEFNKPTSKFYHLIDPNWVLMVPPTKCILEGYGPQSIKDTPAAYCDGTIGRDGSCDVNLKQRTDVVRAKTCVDYQTCLAQDAEGHCIDSKDNGDGTAKGYGYCLQEQRVSQFTGKECSPANAGCIIFQDSQTKQSTPYIKLSLEKNADLSTGKCTEDNAGCRWLSAIRQFQPGTAPNTGKIALNVDKQAKIKIVPIPTGATGVNTQQEWSSATADRVYFASKAEKCQPEAEGCREVSGVVGMTHLRLAPASYECDKDGIDPYGNTVPWYKRADCKQFTGMCKLEYVGCEQYTPTNDTFSLTGISPDDSAAATNPYQYRCPAQCANIKNFIEKKTLFDPLKDGSGADIADKQFNFSADTGRKCSINDVGCEEFTNVNVAASGGEGKEYYTYLQQCEQKKAEDVPADQVFLTFEGSDTAGGQPVKQYVVGDNDTDPTNTDPVPTADGFNFDTWQPKCADKDKPCDCNDATAERQKFDARIGTILCKEFINAKGKSFYRYTDNLIYFTQDCTPYRRTLDGDSATNKLYSSGLSRQCTSPEAVNCREYHAPTAGNIHVVSYDNFEDEALGGWSISTFAGTDDQVAQANKRDMKVTGDGEVLGDHSLHVFRKIGVTETLQYMQIVKQIAMKNEASYTVTFAVRGPAGTSATAIVASKNYTPALVGEPTAGLALNGSWQLARFVIDGSRITDQDRLELVVFSASSSFDLKDVYFDDIVIKETDGIEYVIKDTWEKNGMCFNGDGNTPPAPNFASPAYLGCQLYSDSQGGQHAIRTFSKVCPLEMAGCVEAKIKEGTYNAGATPPKLEDKTAYIIPDPSKQCSPQDNKCTAYGSPKLLTKTDGAEQLKTIKNLTQDTTRGEWKEKEDWNIAYYKVTPEEAVAAQDKFRGGDTSGYEHGICRAATYGAATTAPILPKATTLGDLGCREYLAGSNADKTYFRDPGNSVCQPPKTGQSRGYYYTCNDSDTISTNDIVCRKDDDCPVKNDAPGKCNINTEIQTNCPLLPLTDTTASAYVQSCQASEAGCRKIVDPECAGQCSNDATKSCGQDSECGLNNTCGMSKIALRTDYGRSAANPGTTCKREYYFTDNLQERADQCERAGGVNANAGCLLFSDESKEKWEYKIVNTTTGTIVPIAVNPNDNAVKADFAITPPTYCTCDVSEIREDDCATPHDASPLAPEFCYNRYNQAATNTGPLLRKYKRVRTDTIYNSTALYKCAEASGEGKTSLTNSPATACAGTSTVIDANTLIKVKPDRSCKTWLSCQTVFYDGGDVKCITREPCSKAASDGITCATPLDLTAAPHLNNLLKDDANKTARKDILSLSGYARPDYQFNNGGVINTTTGGYSSFMQGWSVAPDIIADPSLPYDILQSDFKICSGGGNNLQPCAVPADCTGGTCVEKKYLNACRLSPQQDSPKTFTEVVDSCSASGGSPGIPGYCLQPYPRFAESYSLSSPDLFVCKNNPGTPTANIAALSCSATSVPKVHRYYEDYCLNWYPAAASSRGGAITASSGGPFTGYTPPTEEGRKVLNYCIKTAQKNPSLSLNLGYYFTKTILQPPYLNKTTRNSALEISGNELKFHDCGDDAGEVKIEFDLSGKPHAPCKKISDYQPNGNKFILFLWDNDFGKVGTPGSTEYDVERFYPANSDELGVQKRFIDSIDVTFEGATENQYTVANYVQLFPQYDAQTITSSMIANNEYLKGDYAQDRSSNANNSRGCKYYESESDISLNHGVSFLIKPVFSGPGDTATLTGWTAKMCGWRMHVAALSIDMNLKSIEEISAPTPINISYADTYCSEFVTVIREANAVFDFGKYKVPGWMGESAQTFDPQTSSTPYILMPGGRLQSCSVSSFKTTTGLATGVTGFWKTTNSFLKSDGTESDDAAIYVCGTDRTELNSNSTLINPTGQTSTRGQYPGLADKNATAGSSGFTGLRTDAAFPFFKIYEDWQWNATNNKYEKVGDLGDSANALPVSLELKNFWAASKAFGVIDTNPNWNRTDYEPVTGTNRPRIYGESQHKPNQFTVQARGDNTLSLSFFVDVKTTQLPLRNYAAYDDSIPGVLSTISLAYKNSGDIDGFGIQDWEAPDNADPTVQPKVKVYTTKYTNRQNYGINALQDRRFCVQVQDNWEACTRTCATLKRGNFASDGTFTQSATGNVYGPTSWATDASCRAW